MKRLVLALVLLSTPVFAQQQQADVNTLQKALAVLQQQRNNAMDALASATTQATMLQEENNKLKAEIEEMKKPKEPKVGQK